VGVPAEMSSPHFIIMGIGKIKYGKIEMPEPKWKVNPLKGWTFYLETRPCLWNRIWYRLIFGWKFEAV